MKNKLLSALLIVSLMFMSVGVGAYAATKLNLIVNGQVVNADPQLIDGVTYVPLRAVAELLDATVGWDGETNTVTVSAKGRQEAAATNDAILHFPADKYPETAAHIQAAIAKGESAVCTIDRAGADGHREKSLAGIPTKEGYDRDEWPMAMCAEGGVGADIEYVTPADNRGAGSFVSNELRAYTDGTRVLFVIDGGGNSEKPAQQTEKTNTDVTIFKSCTEVKSAGKAPIHKGDPGYSLKLDRDGDGVACE